MSRDQKGLELEGLGVMSWDGDRGCTKNLYFR